MQLRLQAAGRPRDQEGQPGSHGGKSQEDLRRLYFDSETEKRVQGGWGAIGFVSPTHGLMIKYFLSSK